MVFDDFGGERVAAATYLCTLPPAPVRGAMKRSAWFYLVQRSVYDRLGHVDQMHDRERQVAFDAGLVSALSQAVARAQRSRPETCARDSSGDLSGGSGVILSIFYPAVL